MEAAPRPGAPALALRLSDGTPVLLFHLADGALRCIDRFCYHLGEALDTGEIEDLAGRVCVVCPWHEKRIDLRTGETFLDVG